MSPLDDSSLILPNTTHVKSLSARLTHVETELAVVRNNQAAVWTAVEELQRSLPNISTTLATLTAQTDRVDRERHRIIEGIERLSERIAPVVATVAAQGVIASEHINDCERDRRERAVVDAQRHEENQLALTRMDTRTRRVERIYYFVATAIILLGFMSSDLGARLYHQLVPVITK